MFPKLEAVLSSKFVYSSGSDNPRARSATATNPELLISTKTDDVTTITYTSNTSRNYLFSFSVNGARDSRKVIIRGEGKRKNMFTLSRAEHPGTHRRRVTKFRAKAFDLVL